MKIYNFLFYKSYKLSYLLGNKGFYPEVNAWFISILLPWLNLLSILIFLKNNLVISKEIFRFTLIGSTSIWVISFVVILINRKYVEIIKEQEEFEKKRKYSHILFYSYALITGIIYFGFLSS